MPWSVAVICIALLAVWIPFYGEYVALLIVFAASMLIGGLAIALRQFDGAFKAAGGILGINPVYVAPACVAIALAAIGITLLVRSRGVRSSQREIGTLILGLLLVVTTAAYRITHGWPT